MPRRAEPVLKAFAAILSPPAACKHPEQGTEYTGGCSACRGRAPLSRGEPPGRGGGCPVCVCPVVPPVPPPRPRQPLRPGGPGPVARSVPGGGGRFRPRYNRALLVPVLADLTSLLTTSRQTGVHLPNLQPAAGQFFASLDPINEASAILGPLNTNPRSSVQHQFQDTFPGTARPSSTLPWRRALRPAAPPPPSRPRPRLSPPEGLAGRF